MSRYYRKSNLAMVSSLRWKTILALAAGFGVISLVGAKVLRAADTASPATKPAAAPPQPPRNDNQYDRRNRRNRSNSMSVVAPAPTAGAQPNLEQITALQTRSIFVKGNQTIAVINAGPSRGNSSGNNGGGSRNDQAGPMVGKPESSLVFTGVTIIDEEADALIEDLSNSKVSLVHSGDPIAGGKVSAITLDDLTYTVGGVAKHVQIGENLDGVPATIPDTLPTPTTLPSGPTPGGPNPGGPGVSPTATPPAPTRSFPTGTSPEDIEARLKAKRAAELNGK